MGKEDSVYAKMREEEKKLPIYLRVGQSRSSKSGRNTPSDYNSYNADDRSKSDSLTYQDSGASHQSEGSRNYIRSVKNRKKSGEDTENDPDVLVAGINRLRRQGKDHSTEVSEVSDGFKTPDDTESITSDIFGAPDFVKDGEDSFADRFSGRSSAVPRPTRKSYTKDISD